MNDKNQNQIVEPNKKVSSIEWLINQVEDFIGLIPIDIIEQAKTMHREEIIDAHLTGLIYPLEMEATKQAEQYYNDTYGGDQ